MLDKDTTFRALRRLVELAREKNIRLSLTIYGGTVMMLAYNTRPGTKDSDAIFRPREEVGPLVALVGREMNLGSDWLNDDVKMWVAENEADALVPFAEMTEAVPGLVAKRPSAKYLLAMKARAGRLPLPGQKGDHDDLVFLLRHTRNHDARGGRPAGGKVFPARLPPREAPRHCGGRVERCLPAPLA